MSTITSTLNATSLDRQTYKTRRSAALAEWQWLMANNEAAVFLGNGS
jgi:hypothetical protein